MTKFDLILWVFGVGCLVVAAAGSVFCSGNGATLQVKDPTEVCAQALALSPDFGAEAAKVGLTALELGRKTCAAAVLGGRIAVANLPLGTAGSAGMADAAGAAGAAQ